MVLPARGVLNDLCPLNHSNKLSKSFNTSQFMEAVYLIITLNLSTVGWNVNLRNISRKYLSECIKSLRCYELTRRYSPLLSMLASTLTYAETDTSVSSLSGYDTLKCGHLLISDCVQCFNGVLLHNNESTPWTAEHVAVSPWNNVLSDLCFLHCITPGCTCVISDASVVHAPSVVKRELAKIAFFPAISSTPCLTGR